MSTSKGRPSLSRKLAHLSPVFSPHRNTLKILSLEVLLHSTRKKEETGDVLGRSKIGFSPFFLSFNQPLLWRTFLRKWDLNQFIFWVPKDNVLALPVLFVLIPVSAFFIPYFKETIAWFFPLLSYCSMSSVSPSLSQLCQGPLSWPLSSIPRHIPLVE